MNINKSQYSKVCPEKDRKNELALFYNKRIRSIEEVFNVIIFYFLNTCRKLKTKNVRNKMKV